MKIKICGLARACDAEAVNLAVPDYIGFVFWERSRRNVTAETAERLRRRLKNGCTGCRYCMPCPAGIEINNCARMSLLLRRSPSAGHLSPEGQAKMKKIEDCLHCGHCKSMCPYGLDTPKLLEENYKDYKEVLAGKRL